MELRTSLITTRRIVFTPSVDVKDELKNTSIQITCLDEEGNVLKRVTSSDDGEIEDNENESTGNGSTENGGSENNGGGSNGGGTGTITPGGGDNGGNGGGGNPDDDPSGMES